MTKPQMGIFSLGTSNHAWLELDALPGVRDLDVVRAVAELDEPRRTVGGVNFVVGVRPQAWAAVAPDHSAGGQVGFDAPLVGPDGFTMPSTQHDLFVWISGSARDVIFDLAGSVCAALASVAAVADYEEGWDYRNGRDLTGFIDGTENPSLVEAPEIALVPKGSAGAGSSLVLVQKWRHLHAEWQGLTVEHQQQAMGRTKDDSTELDPLPEGSHVARTKLVVDGEEQEIFRRNTPYGNLAAHGTMVVAFCANQGTLQRMLERMAGVGDGIRDELTRFSEPLTGAYYSIPSLDALDSLREDD